MDPLTDATPTDLKSKESETTAKDPENKAVANIRKARTPNDKFDPDELATDLKDIANRSKHNFAWDASDYAKSRRSQGPDPKGLELYKEPLTVLVRRCPSGYPGYKALSNTFDQFCFVENCSSSFLKILVFKRPIVFPLDWKSVQKNYLRGRRLRHRSRRSLTKILNFETRSTIPRQSLNHLGKLWRSASSTAEGLME